MIPRVETNRNRRTTIFSYLPQGISFELRNTKGVCIIIDQKQWKFLEFQSRSFFGITEIKSVEHLESNSQRRFYNLRNRTLDNSMPVRATY